MHFFFFLFLYKTVQKQAPQLLAQVPSWHLIDSSRVYFSEKSDQACIVWDFTRWQIMYCASIMCDRSCTGHYVHKTRELKWSNLCCYSNLYSAHKFIVIICHKTSSATDWFYVQNAPTDGAKGARTWMWPTRSRARCQSCARSVMLW